MDFELSEEQMMSRNLARQFAEQDMLPSLRECEQQRRINIEALPARRVVVRFEFTDVERKFSLWWLVLEAGQADVCLADPGFPTDLWVTTTVRLMAEIWMGEVEFRRALGPDLVIAGPRSLARSLPDWLQLSVFAGVKPVPPGTPKAAR